MCAPEQIIIVSVSVWRECCFCFLSVGGVGWTAVWLAALRVRRGRSSTSLVTELVNGTRYERLLLLLLFIPPPLRTRYIYYLFYFFLFSKWPCVHCLLFRACVREMLSRPVADKTNSDTFDQFARRTFHPIVTARACPARSDGHLVEFGGSR